MHWLWRLPNTWPTNLQTFDELSLVSGDGEASSLQLLLEVVDFHLKWFGSTDQNIVKIKGPDGKQLNEQQDVFFKSNNKLSQINKQYSILSLAARLQLIPHDTMYDT